MLEKLDEKTYVSHSDKETERVAELFAHTFRGGETVLLEGEMGTGKTRFAKGAAKGMGIKETVTSPTFALHNTYGGKKLTLNHFDFYRINDGEEIRALGLDEYFGIKDSVALIEWSVNVKELLPKNTLKVTLEKVGENVRRISFSEKK